MIISVAVAGTKQQQSLLVLRSGFTLELEGHQRAALDRWPLAGAGRAALSFRARSSQVQIQASRVSTQQPSQAWNSIIWF